jgi:phytoene synthase
VTTLAPPISAYQYCQELTKREAKNFYYGFFLLSPPRRRAIYAAVDQDLPNSEKETLLAAYREKLDRCLAGQCDDEVFIALNHALHAFNIPSDYFYQLIDGVQIDLKTQRYASFEELHRYCYHVASVVGLISIEVFGYRGGEEARQHALDLGVALQLTNILRDIQEDADRGRVYIPLDDLARFSYSEDQLLRGVVNEGFRQLMAFEAERARGYYESGRQLLPLLSRRSRACVGVMAGIYSRLLDYIERQPEVVFQERVSLSTRQKLALASRELVRSVVPL